MDNLVETALGEEAIEYIRERLANGKSLAKHVLKHVDVDCGFVRTLLPDYVPLSSARKLKVGGVLRVDPQYTRYETGKDGRQYRVEAVHSVNWSFVAAIEASLNSRLCVFEEGIASLSDPWINRRPFGRLLPLGEEIYWLIDSAASHEDIEWTVAHSAFPWPGLLAFSISETDLPMSGNELDPIVLEVVVRHLEELVVGAYDGEAFVYWTPN